MFDTFWNLIVKLLIDVHIHIILIWLLHLAILKSLNK